MSWPLGYGAPSLRLHASLDGVIFAGDVPLTDRNGWIDLPMPDAAKTPDGPAEYSLRIRLSVDVQGKVFLYAEEVDVGGRRFAGLYALAKTRGDHWLSAPSAQVKRAIEARVAAARAGQATTAVASARARTDAPSPPPEPAGRPGADDTWDHRVRHTRAFGT